MPTNANTSWVWLLAVATSLSGAAGLTWEVIWQAHTTLALGASAFGAAVTLSFLMVWLGIGSIWAETSLKRGWVLRPLRAYAVAEFTLAIGALLVPVVVGDAGRIDTWVYRSQPGIAQWVHVVTIGLAMAIPSFAMGTTLPFLARVAERTRWPISRFYMVNLVGAVLGVLLVTFVAMPNLGIRRTEWATAGINLLVGLLALLLDRTVGVKRFEQSSVGPTPVFVWSKHRVHLLIAWISGCAVFTLEVSWFRSIRSAYASTTESFAIVLAAFLIPLSLGAALAPAVRKRFANALPLLLALAGFAVLIATPFVDGVDRHTIVEGGGFGVQVERLTTVMAILLLPVTLQGMVLPWLFDLHKEVGSGFLYAANTFGAFCGALTAGFLFLPWIGATYTSWAAAALYLLCALAITMTNGVNVVVRTAIITGLGLLGMVSAGQLNPGTARDRVQGFNARFDFGRVLYVDEGPDATVWVTTSTRSGRRKLVIDGFEASGEGVSEHYMPWMGHLPALAVPNLRSALVICFGTGQTANAVRQHGPQRLEIADISAGVLRAAPLFLANDGVLEDSRVRATVMDGRAFLRRRSQRYDVITLEPMPPNFAGTNSLYSREFYALARSRLNVNGVVAQWVPFHLISASDMKSIVATFIAELPHSRLWIDPISGTGILLGSTHPWRPDNWPSHSSLDLSIDQVRSGFVLDRPGLTRLARSASLITDDNQQLAYGVSRFSRYDGRRGSFLRVYQRNIDLVMAAR